MGKIYYIIGKSASGKDSIFRLLKEDAQLGLKTIVLYTTRPKRSGEMDGREYHFTDEEKLKDLRQAGKIIEERVYHTVFGDWYYFTADDGTFDAGNESWLGIGTLESYEKLKDYFGEDRVCPLYITVDPYIRLTRALAREKSQENPSYTELCRRFLADEEDFSEEKLEKAGVKSGFSNDGQLSDCVEAVKKAILSEMKA